MDDQFKEIEETFNQIKMQFQKGEISRQNFIDQMKRMRLKDEQGRFWMLGAQSGKWYYFDGKDWIQSEPPSSKEKKAICIYCGFENKLEADVCGRCGGNLGEKENICPKCRAKLEEPDFICPKCSQGPEKEEITIKAAKDEGRGEYYIFRSLNPVSSLFFAGALGLLIGIILGAFAGTTAYFSEAVSFLPSTLLEFQGKLLGAILYAALGGIFGFFIFGIFGLLQAFIINLILYFVGGIRIMLLRPVEKKKKKEKRREKDFDFDFELRD